MEFEFPLLPGDFGVVHTHHGNLWDDFAEWAICFGTNAPVNHAFVYIGGNEIIEAVRYVRASPVSNYSNIIWSSGAFALTNAQRTAIVDAAHSYLGRPYNLLDIGAIALAQSRLGGLVDSDDWVAKRLSNDGHLICSQLVDAAYLQAGVHLFKDGRLPGLVSPGDLWRLLPEGTGKK